MYDGNGVKVKNLIFGVIIILAIIFCYKYFYSDKAKLTEEFRNNCLISATKRREFNNKKYKDNCACLAETFFNRPASKNTIDALVKMEDERYLMILKSFDDEEIMTCEKKSGIRFIIWAG